jgi:hypothetical protein
MLVSISNTLVCRFCIPAHDMIPNSAFVVMPGCCTEVEQIAKWQLQLPVIGKLDRTNIWVK